MQKELGWVSAIEWMKDEKTIPESSDGRLEASGAHSSCKVQDICDKSVHPMWKKEAPMTRISMMAPNQHTTKDEAQDVGKYDQASFFHCHFMIKLTIWPR